MENLLTNVQHKPSNAMTKGFEVSTRLRGPFFQANHEKYYFCVTKRLFIKVPIAAN